MLRIAFFGTPEFAVPTLTALLASRHPVVVAVTQPDRPKGRGHKLVAPPVKDLALAHGVPVLQPERLRTSEILDALRAMRLDLGVVAAYGKILPEPLLALPRLGLVNVHASLLPRWRGASPVEHAVMAGDQQTGVTIMRVVKALDAGGMLARVVRPIGPEETSAEIERDLARQGAHLLVSTLDAIEAGTVVDVPQDESAVTYAPRLAKEQGLVDWSLPALVLHNRIRGLQPWPLCHAWLGGDRLAFLRARPVDPPPVSAKAASPGQVVEVQRDRLMVACGEGTALALLALQPEGRRVMDARDFLLGHHVEPGMRFHAAVAP